MACRQALPWSRCTASHGLGLRLMTSRLACSSCAIERGVQMARVVREDWPHLDMDMGKRQVGEGKWAGEEGARAHTLQGLIRRASRLSPVSAVSAVYYNVVLLFRVLVSCGSSRRPCEVTSVLGLPGARDTDHRHRRPSASRVERVVRDRLIIAHPHDRRIPTIITIPDAGP
jgi:hypothetical protein